MNTSSPELLYWTAAMLLQSDKGSPQKEEKISETLEVFSLSTVTRKPANSQSSV